MLSRRGLITGLAVSLVAAPAIVRAASLMPVRGIIMPVEPSLQVWTMRYVVEFVTHVEESSFLLKEVGGIEWAA